MEGTIGEIRLFAANFAPRNWAYCAGQILSISSNTALFSILGCTFGGNCQTTFALPDLRGRTAFSPGQGPGLTNRSLGQIIGAPTVTLTTNQIPSHTHSAFASASPSDLPNPLGNVWAGEAVGATFTYKNANPNGSMASSAISFDGGNQSHNNMEPSLALNYIICLFGMFPSRN